MCMLSSPFRTLMNRECVFLLGDVEEMKTRLLQLEQENTKVIASLWIVCQIRQGVLKKNWKLLSRDI